jgi:hypothetical protein
MTKAVHDQRDRIFGREPALPAVENLVFADPGCRGFMFHL